MICNSRTHLFPLLMKRFEELKFLMNMEEDPIRKKERMRTIALFLDKDMEEISLCDTSSDEDVSHSLARPHNHYISQDQLYQLKRKPTNQHKRVKLNIVYLPLKSALMKHNRKLKIVFYWRRVWRCCRCLRVVQETQE